MFATRVENTITISKDISLAFCGLRAGYKVVLHALPQYQFHVDATTVDEAQRIAYTVAKREKAPMLRDTDAADITRL